MTSRKRPVSGFGTKKGPPTLDPAVRSSRRKGALLGLAIGDALGAPLQDKRLPAPDFPELVDGPLTEMLGNGALGMRPGQVGRATQMACCLVEVLKGHGAYAPAEALRAYRAWSQLCAPTGPQLEPLFQAYENGGAFPEASIRHWVTKRTSATGNLSLARTVPLGVFFSEQEQPRLEASCEDSALTHFHPLCQLACACLNAAIASAIEAPERAPPERMLDAAAKALRKASVFLSGRYPEFSTHIQEASTVLMEDLQGAPSPDPQLYGPELHLHSMAGHVRVTFRLAFFELCHAPGLEAALIDVIHRGGDTSSNAAVTGALLGARLGREAFPERWADAVLQALSNTFPRPPTWTRYHPRLLLELVE